MKIRPVRFSRFTVAAALAVVLATVLTAFAATASYREVPAGFLPVIEAAERAFDEKKGAEVGAYLAEDYSWWQVTPEGPREAVRGRAATVALIERFFGSGAWVSSRFERLGMVGNILVQVEEDVVLEAGKPVTKVTLNLYEFRDGRRWREWKFFPQGSGPGGDTQAAAVTPPR